MSFQEGSVYNSEAETNSCKDDAQVVLKQQDDEQKSKVIEHERYLNKKEKLPLLPPTPDNLLQVQSLQEEILTLRSQIALLQAEISTRDHFYEKISNPESNQNFECCKYQDENKSNYIDNHHHHHHQILELEEEKMKNLPVLKNISNVPILKVAERVKLKQITEDNLPLDNDVSHKKCLIDW